MHTGRPTDTHTWTNTGTHTDRHTHIPPCDSPDLVSEAAACCRRVGLLRSASCSWVRDRPSAASRGRPAGRETREEGEEGEGDEGGGGE